MFLSNVYLGLVVPKIPGICISAWRFSSEKKCFQGNTIFHSLELLAICLYTVSHLTDKLLTPYQKNCFLFTANHSLSHFQPLQNCWSVSLQVRAPVIQTGDGQIFPGQGNMVSVERFPIQASSNFHSLDLRRLMTEFPVAKSLCFVFWPIPVVFYRKVVPVIHVLQ